MLLIEVNLDAYRLARQNALSVVMYHELLIDNINGVIDKRMNDLKEIEKVIAHVAKAYRIKA